MANKRNRRNFLKELAGTVAGAAAATGLAATAAAPAEAFVPPAPSPAPGPIGPGVVHWVSEGRRCIEARVLELVDGVARLEFAQRPAAAGRTYLERAENVPHCELDPDALEAKYRPGTWHTADHCPCGRAYSDWWYGRKRKSGPVLVDARARAIIEREMDGKMRFLDEQTTHQAVTEMAGIEDWR